VHDVRASFFAWLFGAEDGLALLARAVEAGYAPAQAQLSAFAVTGEDEFNLAQRAASQFDRNGLFELGNCYSFGRGCAEDETKAVELYRQAAELDCPAAQVATEKLSLRGPSGSGTTGTGAPRSAECGVACLCWQSWSCFLSLKSACLRVSCTLRRRRCGEISRLRRSSCFTAAS
jgi:TPR repeat protein